MRVDHWQARTVGLLSRRAGTLLGWKAGQWRDGRTGVEHRGDIRECRRVICGGSPRVDSSKGHVTWCALCITVIVAGRVLA